MRRRPLRNIWSVLELEALHSESKPKEAITKQKCTESVYTLRGLSNGKRAWHVVLIPYDKQASFESLTAGGTNTVNSTEFGQIIQYRNEHGWIKAASGFGEGPSEDLMKWIAEHYDVAAAVDENASLVYVKDDIRLCTMQRSTPEQLLGIHTYYHRQENFHYITLNEDFQSTLAYRAGVKNYDRLIELNGNNIEKDTVEELSKRFEINRHLPVQILVCNPATYAHYKSNNKCMHSDLPTVKRLKPVHDTPLSAVQTTDRGFCAAKWENTSKVGVVTKSSVLKPPDLIEVNDICTIEVNGWHRKGQIILTGSQSECEALKTDESTEPYPKTKAVDQTNLTNVNQSDIFFTAAAQDLDRRSPPATEAAFLDRAQKKNEKKDSGHEEQNKNLLRLISILLNTAEYETDKSRNDVHYVQCDNCGKSDFNSDRYKCLQCNDYDLCAACFEKRCESKGHLSGHAFAHFTNPGELFGAPITGTDVTLTKFKERFALERHENITCDNCGKVPIIGLRFKCDTCHNYDLCLTCMETEKTSKKHERTHPLIVIGKDRLLKIDFSDIELGEELGAGAFGTVYKAKWIPKNRQVACKVINVSSDQNEQMQSFLKELSAYSELSGAYILKTFGYSIHKPASARTLKCMLVMEFMSRGSLKSVIKHNEKISIRRKLAMACNIASGMRKLHQHNMIHRDIRPDNILVTQDYTTKIGDMGIARAFDASQCQHLTIIGCIPFMPPEFYTGKYDQSLDVFTFGLTLYELFVEKSHDFDQATRRISFPTKSPVFDELIRRCTHSVPNQRPSATEIEFTLDVYRLAFDKAVVSLYPSYIKMPTEEKNRVFIKFYEAFHPEVKAELERKFPPPPPPPAAVDENNDEAKRMIKLLAELVRHAHRNS